MTREDALNIMTDHDGWITSEVEEIINKIYDDFESRICKNCIHYDKKDKVCILLDMGVLNNTFGCKAFEQKEIK